MIKILPLSGFVDVFVVKGRTGDVFVDTQTLSEAFRKLGFTAAQITDQQEDLTAP